MGTINKMVNRVKSWFTHIKNAIITQKIDHYDIPKTEQFQGKRLETTEKSPWWITEYHSKSRPKLTRLQPLKEFGTFKKRKPIYGLEN